jgi:bifunctional N-acetylglucosamine-1-phosphate-uridyltransferase/glucosamine-1-phosphate-acetyltransferase GlmU-like protein
MEIIIPCAGASSRFPNKEPKYLLEDYSGKLMVQRAAEQYNKYKINIVILDEHNEKYNASEKLKKAFNKDVNIIILKKKTKGPAETVYEALGKSNISSFLVKDCDSFYKSKQKQGNIVNVAKISKYPEINPNSKSFVQIKNEKITKIIEKKVISDIFCVGGYQFESSKKFVNYFERYSENYQKEIFISNIINYMIKKGEKFNNNDVLEREKAVLHAHEER